MKRNLIAASLGMLIVSAAITSGGCSGITPEMTLSQALQTLSQNPLLNQITVGDLVQAFRDFTASNGHGPNLSDDQLKQIEELQAQLDAGQITRDEFESKVRDIIGDAAPGMAFGGFGFFGSPFGHHFEGPLSGDLALTDEQQEQAREIFSAAHDDIAALRKEAHDNILNNVLTQEQRDTLAQIQEQFPRFGNWNEPLDNARGGRGHGGFGGPGGPGNGPRPGMGFGPRPGLINIRERIAEALGLTDEQKAQIEQIRADLREAVKARHELAREEFRAILTAEQLAALDAFESEHPHPEPGDDSAQ